MSRADEFAAKQEQLRALLDACGLAGVALGRVASVAWAGCGADTHIVLASDTAFATLLVTHDRVYLLADRVELPRLLAEEFGELPVEAVTYEWHSPGARDALLAQLAPGRLGSDCGVAQSIDLRDDLMALRLVLHEAEQVRYRALCAALGAALSTACGELAPGMTEHAIAGVLSEECYLRDLTPVVVLVATDERIWRFRHPIPTAKPLERYAELVLCARKHGMIAAASRLVHFGHLPDDLRARMHACARVDAAALAATRPGTPLAAIFARIQQAYAAEGFPDEWQLHHQGGPIGYEPREFIVTPARAEHAQEGQAIAWNISISGVKSEDTFLLTRNGPEILTLSPDWPTLAVEVDGVTYQRPAVLELEAS